MIIHLDRVYLEPIQPKHGYGMNMAIKYSYNDLKEWLYWLDKIPTEQESLAFCEKTYQDFLEKKSMQFAIINKQDDSFIGCIGVHNFNYNNTSGYLDIGYWINTKYSKKGYMLEALKGLVKSINKNFSHEKVFLTTDTKNIPSNNLAIKSGFTLLETRLNDLKKPNGLYRDTNVYSLNLNG